jgi:5-methylcytosine-specific restriction enzyme A
MSALAQWPYSTTRWQRLRARRLKMQPLCAARSYHGRIVPAREVDHIHPISKGGAVWEIDNLQSLCSTHHSLKSWWDRTNRYWADYFVRGCDEDGNPRDPDHPWHEERNGHASIKPH